MNSRDDFTTRELQPRDLPLLAVLSDWLPVEWKSGAGALEHRWLALVQHVDGTEVPAGVVEYQQIADEGHLLGIAIMPALRGRGLAMRLLHATLDEMRGSGCARCLLEVRRSNVAARNLYEHARFTLDGVRKDYYPPQDSGQREDALLYSRTL